MSKTTIPTGGITADAIDATLIADDAISEEHLDATALTGHTALGATPADTDELLVSDAGTLKRVDYSYLKSGSLTKVGSSTSLRSSHASANISDCFTSTYDVYLVTYAITTDRDSNSVTFKFGTGSNNASFLTSGYNYHQFGYPSNGTSITQRNSDPSTVVQLSEGTMGSESSNMWSAWGNIMIYRPSSTTEFKPFDFRGAWYDTSGHVRTINGAGRNSSTTAITGMRFNPSANYFFTSDIHVYGLET